jgi:hypothetical protein
MTTPSARKRPDISMSREEIEAFLETQSRVIVVALDDGAPTGTVADLDFADGQLAVTLRAGDGVAGLLAHDARVCVIAEHSADYYEIKGVAAHGRADDLAAADGRVGFTLGLDDTTSFDFGKLPREGKGSGRSAG